MDDSSSNDGDETSEGVNDDKVGYGRPPKEHQFKKGRSGNPRGRPKGSKGFETMLREGLRAQVQVKVDGTVKSMSVGQALLMRLLREGVSGNRMAADQGLRLMERYGMGENTVEEPYDLTVLTDAELEEMHRMSAKMLGQEEQYHEERARQLEQSKAAHERIFGEGSFERAEAKLRAERKL